MRHQASSNRRKTSTSVCPLINKDSSGLWTDEPNTGNVHRHARTRLLRCCGSRKIHSRCGVCMQDCSQGGSSFFRFVLAVCSSVGLTLGGCDSVSPSQRLNTAIQLPIPTAAASAPSAERLSRDREDETYVLSARSHSICSRTLNRAFSVLSRRRPGTISSSYRAIRLRRHFGPQTEWLNHVRIRLSYASAITAWRSALRNCSSTPLN